LLNHSDSIPEEFASQIQPKLRALQLVAAENARANADRQRARINKNAIPPSFKVGQKVLLYDPITKTHEFSKLKIRYRGPYEIVSEPAKYRYILRDLITQKESKRPVHADRLRPFHELADQQSIKGRITEVCLTSVTTRHRKLAVKITIADITMSQCDAIVCFLRNQLGMMTGTTRDILRSIDENIIQNCLEYIQAGEYQQALETPATGLKDPIKYIMHAVIATSSVPEELPELVQDETLRQRIIACLELADRRDIKSIN
jgi:hypothetical protein